MADIETTLTEYILTQVLKRPKYQLGKDDALISSGLIDSFAMAQVGVFIEVTFDLYIPDPDLTVENMDTIGQISDRILQGLASQGSGMV